MKRLIAVVALMLVAACTTTRSNTADLVEKPPPGARILVIEPDVELAILTTAGLQEPRADWSQQGRDNLNTSLQSVLAQRAHTFAPLDPDEATEGRIGQLLRLHEAVGQSILLFKYGFVTLPTKKEGFDWTLGEGAQKLGEEYDADYALFTFARGSYASGGRVAAMIGLSLLGVGVPLGGQQMFVSLVDLKTGKVIWFNVATAAPDADMREQDGAARLMATVMKDAPL